MASPFESKPQIQSSMAESKPQHIDNVTNANLHQHVKDESSDVIEEKPTTANNIINYRLFVRVPEKEITPIFSQHSEGKLLSNMKLRDGDVRNMEKQQAETFKKYEAEFTNYLKAKYFSDKDIYEGDIFEKKTTVDGKTIKAGRFPGTKSYADPAAFKDESSSSRVSPASEATNVSNGNIHTAK